MPSAEVVEQIHQLVLVKPQLQQRPEDTDDGAQDRQVARVGHKIADVDVHPGGPTFHPPDDPVPAPSGPRCGMSGPGEGAKAGRRSRPAAAARRRPWPRRGRGNWVLIVVIRTGLK